MSASQAKGLNPVIPIRVAKRLGRTRKEDTFEVEMFLDSGSMLNMMSERLAKINGVFIDKEDSINYRAQDIQGKDISITGTATLYIVNSRGWKKKIKFCVAKDIPNHELLINFENILELGIIKYDYKDLGDTGFTNNEEEDDEEDELEEDKYGFKIRKVKICQRV